MAVKSWLAALQLLPADTCCLAALFLAGAITWAAEAVPAADKTEAILTKVSPKNRRFINGYDLLVGLVFGISVMLLAATIWIGCLKKVSASRLRRSSSGSAVMAPANTSTWYSRVSGFTVTITVLMCALVVLMTGVLAYTVVWWAACLAAEQVSARTANVYRRAVAASNKALAVVDKAWQAFLAVDGGSAVNTALTGAFNSFSSFTGINTTTSNSLYQQVVNQAGNLHDYVSGLNNVTVPALSRLATNTPPELCNTYFCLDLGAYTLFDSTDCFCEPDIILYVNSLAGDAKKLLYGAIVGEVIMIVAGIILLVRLGAHHVSISRDEQHALVEAASSKHAHPGGLEGAAFEVTKDGADEAPHV